MSTKSNVYDRRASINDGWSGNILVGGYGQDISSGTNSPRATSATAKAGRPRKPRSLLLEENPYSCIHNHIEDGLHYFTRPAYPWVVDYKANWGTWGYGYVTESNADKWGSNDELELLSKLASQIRGHDFNLAVSAAEAGQTLSMIALTATRLGRAIHDLKRGDLRSVLGSLTVSKQQSARAKTRVDRNDIGGAWLELQYGWIPLLSDVKSAAEALAWNQIPHTMTIRVGRSRNFEMASPVGFRCVSDCRISRRYKVVLYDDMGAFDGLGLTDPATVVWELVPYSFVADWFIPIGDYLDTRSVLRNAKAVKVIQSTRLVKNFSIPGVNSCPDANGTRMTTQGSGYVQRYTSLNRVVLSALPDVPLPTFKPLQISSLKHCISSIALMSQRFRS